LDQLIEETNPARLPDLSEDLPLGPALVVDAADGPHAADEPVGIGAVQRVVI